MASVTYATLTAAAFWCFYELARLQSLPGWDYDRAGRAWLAVVAAGYALLRATVRRRLAPHSVAHRTVLAATVLVSVLLLAGWVSRFEVRPPVVGRLLALSPEGALLVGAGTLVAWIALLAGLEWLAWLLPPAVYAPPPSHSSQRAG